MNYLYYGDNLDVLRRKIKDDSIDLCYIDPPFNSKRTYNQIYNNVGNEDRAQSQAFIDTWTWDELATQGFTEIIENAEGRFQVKTVELIKGLHKVIGKGSLLAYLISMTLRITEIYRVLKPTGSFYLHCDPTASHYLKLVLDGIFCSQGGDFLNEIIWNYSVGGKGKQHWARKHDVIFYYVKSCEWCFNDKAIRLPFTPHKQDVSGTNYGGRMGVDEEGRNYVEKWGTGKKKLYRYYLDEGKVPEDVWQIQSIQAAAKERMGYPTQKPEELLERIIKASSKENDIVLDAYCGCGTTVAVAERLKRQWIGIDITYQSVALILKRVEDQFGEDITKSIVLDGIPRDMESAVALAHKKDDRVRKEFEKWAVLTYTNNRGIINDKKGADSGIDGTVYFMTGRDENATMVFQVKSGHVSRGDIAKLKGDMEREGAAMATLITLEEPTSPMITEAKIAGQYNHKQMGRNYDKIQIVKIQEIVEDSRRLNLPLALEVLKSATRIREECSKTPLPGMDLD